MEAADSGRERSREAASQQTDVTASTRRLPEVPQRLHSARPTLPPQFVAVRAAEPAALGRREQQDPSCHVFGVRLERGLHTQDDSPGRLFVLFL